MSFIMQQGRKERSCRGKARHRTFANALRAVAESGNQYGDLTLVAYFCEHCSHYHTGHPPKAVQKRLHFDRLLKLIDRANGRVV